MIETLEPTETPANLTDYQMAASSLPSESFLGQISYFTISENDVDLEAARQSLVDLGLSTATLRKRLRTIDAFKKAANEFAHKFEKTGNEHHAFLVRPVGQDSDTSHRHIVLERAVYKAGSRRKLVYDVVATLVFDRSEGLITCTPLTPVGYSFTDEEKEWIESHCAALNDRYEHWCTHLDAHAIRTFVREYLYGLGGISIRQNGGFYFVQQKNLEELQKLGEFVRGVGSQFHTIPLLDITDQRKMLVEAYEAETIDQVNQLSSELGVILGNPDRTITQETYDSYVQKAAELIARTDDYAALLDQNLGKAVVALDIFKRQALQLTTRVRVPKTSKKVSS